MRKLALAGVATASIFLLACGGQVGELLGLNQFVGAYQGNYTLVSSGDTIGNMTFVVSDDGTVTGTGRNTQAGADFTVGGRITTGGQATFNLSGGFAATITGNVTRNSSGRIVGDLTQTVGTVATQIRVNFGPRV